MFTDRGHAHIKRLGRRLLVISLIAMVGIFAFQVVRGEEIPVETIIACLIWATWVGYMLFRSELLRSNKVK